MDNEMLILLWETVREYIPAKDRQTAADHVIDNLVDNGLDDEDLKLFNGVDKYMSATVKEFLEDEDEEEDYEWEEDY